MSQTWITPPSAASSLNLLEMTLEAARRAGVLSAGEVNQLKRRIAVIPSVGLGKEHVTEDALLDIWDVLAQRYGGPEVGALIALNADFNTLGLITEVSLQAQDPEQVYSRIARYNRLLNQRSTIVTRSEGNALSVFYSHPEVAPNRINALEAAMICSVALLALIPLRFFGTPVQPVAARFFCAAPNTLDLMKQIFGSKLRFDQPDAMIRFNRAQLRGLRHDRRPQTLRYLEMLAESDLGRIDSLASLNSQVRALAEAMLAGGAPTHADVARTLGLSPRSLQRRLAEDGTSYSAILDELRRNKAHQLLRSGRYALSEITYMLGYTDQAAFSRAARRWFGTPPRTLRGAAAEAPE